MKIKVGTAELAVNNAYAYRYNNGKLVLIIEVPQANTTHDELYNLIKNNTEDIVRMDDNGTVTETFSGFSYTLTILTTGDIYKAEVECISETERKVGDLQSTVSTQKTTIAEQSETISLIIDDILPNMMLGIE